MENPFELIEARLLRMEQMLEILINKSINQNHQSIDQIGTIDDCSSWIKMSKSSIYKLTSQKRIPYIKKSKHLLFKRDEIMAWLTSENKKTVTDLQEEVENNLYELNKMRQRN